VAYRGRRSFKDGPWHYCARCGSRVHISELEWQRGVLVCKTFDCQDTGVNPLVGQREAEIAEQFERPTQELMPDPKLTEANVSADNDDIFF
jgi:hypothetical protein